MKSKNPIAVCISDIHFNLNTLPLASSALRSALRTAESLNVPLVIAGDLNDSKAIIRAEVANELISILKNAQTPVFIIVGNHDLVNEKGKDNGLNYLSPYAKIVDRITYMRNMCLVPYYNSSEKLLEDLQNIEPGCILIMHQGFLGAAMGDYIQDRTSISTSEVSKFHVISGHYHKYQTVGSVTYIGSPYTITFGEANDGPKGFLILNEDGSFSRKILNLRKHVVLYRSFDDLTTRDDSVNPEDLLQIKVTGPYSELLKLKKADIGKTFIGHSNFKLDLIPLDNLESKSTHKDMSDVEILDNIIKNLSDTEKQKKYLTELYHEIINR